VPPTTRFRRSMVTCLALTLAVGVVGCGDDAVPTPDPASAAAASSASASQQALFEEAKKVHDAFWKLDEQIAAQGGTETLPAEMNDYTMGTFAQLEAGLRHKQWERKQWTKPGTSPSYMGPVIYDGRDQGNMPDDGGEAAIVIESCIDATASPHTDEAGNIYLGDIDYNVFYLKRDADQHLKIYTSWNKDVKTCPVSV
jgi:hypothetical protein